MTAPRTNRFNFASRLSWLFLLAVVSFLAPYAADAQVNCPLNLSPCANPGILTHSGSGTISSGAVYTNDGFITNTGTITNSFGGTLVTNGTLFTNGGTLNNAGTLNITSPNGLLDSAGFLTNQSGGVITNDAVFFNDAIGLFTNELGATLVNNNTLVNNDTMVNAGTFTNTAYFANAGVLTNTGTINSNTLDNSGSLTNSGSITVTLSLTNDTGTTLTNSGTILVNGSLDNYETLTNSGAVTVAGALNNFANLQSTGTFDVTSTGSATNNALSTIDAVTLNIGGHFSNNGTVNMTASNAMSVLATGSLGGTGTINGDVFSAGNVGPGNSPGTLTINGNYTQTSGGAFTAELGGSFAGQYDQLNVSGNASLAGLLNVVLVNGFLVNIGDSFVLITFGSSNGKFGTVVLPSLAAGMQWLLSYNPTNVTLTVGRSITPTVPEPGTMILFATGLSGMWLRRRRRA